MQIIELNAVGSLSLPGSVPQDPDEAFWCCLLPGLRMIASYIHVVVVSPLQSLSRLFVE